MMKIMTEKVSCGMMLVQIWLWSSESNGELSGDEIIEAE